MRKPVEALRVVSNEFLRETRAPLRRRWRTRLFSRRFNSPFRFSRASSWEPEVAFLLARLSSSTGASNPFRIGRCDDDTQVNAKERKRARSSFPLALPLIGSSAILLPFSLLRVEKATQSARIGHEIKYLDPTWGTHYSASCTWALENAAKICNHFRLYRCRPLWPHPWVSLAK